MIKTNSKCSIIICAYTEKRWRDLVAAIESLQRQTLLPYEVIVVIDHNPLLLQRVRHLFPDVVAVENREERGLSGARNSGVAVATGDIIVFLDDDAIAEPDWLGALVKGYEEPNVIGVGGSSLPIWMDKHPQWFPEEFYWVVGCTYRGLPPSTSVVRNLIGCNMSFKREVFDAVGGFRSGIGRIDTRPLGCEETELCIRTNQFWPDGYFVYEPNARVLHNVPGNRASLNYFLARCYSEGLAKALVSKFVGPRDGLSAEWKYSMYTLPTGVLRGVADAILRQKFSGLARAGAIVAGLTVTTTGYCVGRVSTSLAS